MSITGRPPKAVEEQRTCRGGARHGFTLVELVVVLGIVLVMTSIIGPTFRVTPTRQVENTAHMVASQLALARSSALGNHEVLRADFDVPGRAYTAYMDNDNDGVITGSTAEMQAFPQFGRRTLDDLVVFGRGSAPTLPGDGGAGEVTLNQARISFDRQGVPTPWGSMGTIYLTYSRDASAVAAVSVASSGSFTVWRWWPNPGEWR
jgi:prepilin-type N-terminal cleavage/methylation domain-containing protein